MSVIDPYKYEGVYIGLSEENIVVICDLFTKGVFIISTVSDGIVVPFGHGEYRVLDNRFIIEPQRGWIFMIPNLERVEGEFEYKSKLKFGGITTYYHCSIAGREPYSINVDDIERNPMPDRYGKDVLKSLGGFDFSKYDFSGYDLSGALEIAGIDAAKLAASVPDIFIVKKKPLKFGPDRSLLYDKTSGKRIPGAFLDENGELKYRFEKAKKFISHNEASATNNWENVSYNLKDDQQKEIRRAAAANREIRDRMDGSYDPGKNYETFDDLGEVKKWAELGGIEGLDEYFADDTDGGNTDNQALDADTKTGGQEMPNTRFKDESGNKDTDLLQDNKETSIAGAGAQCSTDTPVADGDSNAPAEASPKTAENGVSPEKSPAKGSVVYCFGFEKMYNIAGKYVYVILFLQVENGAATNAIFSTIDDNKRNLEGWRELVAKVSDKIGNSKYLLFKTSFNFVMDLSDILPDTIRCGSIADIPHTEEYRAETLALANNVNSMLISLRGGANLADTFMALTEFFKEVGAVDISVR